MCKCTAYYQVSVCYTVSTMRRNPHPPDPNESHLRALKTGPQRRRASKQCRGSLSSNSLVSFLLDIALESDSIQTAVNQSASTEPASSLPCVSNFTSCLCMFPLNFDCPPLPDKFYMCQVRLPSLTSVCSLCFPFCLSGSCLCLTCKESQTILSDFPVFFGSFICFLKPCLSIS